MSARESGQGQAPSSKDASRRATESALLTTRIDRLRSPISPASSTRVSSTVLPSSPPTVSERHRRSDARRRSSPSSTSTSTPGRSATRIIRTFEEKLVMAEEWYEELECGICSHVLAAPQTLIPCGHTFCGVCAWQWIKTNKNLTCPHCRMELAATTPFVPNIIVDQIIERKLRSLSDGPQRAELLEEREEKSEAWKILQASLPTKPPKRSKVLDEWMMGFFDHGPSASDAVNQTHRRRASLHYAELGAPLHQVRRVGNILGQGGLSLGEIRRLDAAEEALAGSAARSGGRYIASAPNAAESSPRTTRQVRPSTSSPTAPSQQLSNPDGSVSDHTNRPLARSTHPPAEDQPSSPGASPARRPTPLRSRALAARQARGRMGTRDLPLVLLSESEGEIDS